ncbi:hypothetical protein BO443_30195 [Burkholderia orbicola]
MSPSDTRRPASSRPCALALRAVRLKHEDMCTQRAFRVGSNVRRPTRHHCRLSHRPGSSRAVPWRADTVSCANSVNDAHQQIPYSVISRLGIQDFERPQPGKLGMWQLHPFSGKRFILEYVHREPKDVEYACDTIGFCWR